MFSKFRAARNEVKIVIDAKFNLLKDSSATLGGEFLFFLKIAKNRFFGVFQITNLGIANYLESESKLAHRI